jgi:hypothetical protein
VADFQIERPSFFERSISLSKGFVVVFGSFAEPAVFPDVPAVALPPLTAVFAIFEQKNVISAQKNRRIDDTILRVKDLGLINY